MQARGASLRRRRGQPLGTSTVTGPATSLVAIAVRTLKAMPHERRRTDRSAHSARSHRHSATTQHTRSDTRFDCPRLVHAARASACAEHFATRGAVCGSALVFGLDLRAGPLPALRRRAAWLLPAPTTATATVAPVSAAQAAIAAAISSATMGSARCTCPTNRFRGARRQDLCRWRRVLHQRGHLVWIREPRRTAPRGVCEPPPL